MVDTSLRLLKLEQIDIVMIHEPDRPGQYDWFTDWERFHGPVIELLDELKQERVIRFTGIGGTTAYTMAHLIATGRFDVVLTAFNYSLLWQEALIACCQRRYGSGWASWWDRRCKQGALSRVYREEVEHGARWLSPPRREQYRRLYALVDELAWDFPSSPCASCCPIPTFPAR